MEMCANDDELSTDLSTLLISPNFKVEYDGDKGRRASTKCRLIAVGAFLTVCVIVAIVLGVVLPAVFNENVQELSQSELGNFTYAAVATDGAQCAAIGKDILQKNGSVVDSAIATLLCMGVVLPQSMGIGGGFLMTIYIRENNTAEVLDAREVAPSGATEEMYGDSKDASQHGGLAVAVPGELHGMYTAWKRYGKLPWKELFAPAIKLCHEGFPVAAHLVEAAQTIKDHIQNNTEMRDLLINSETGVMFKTGETMRNRKLGDTLQKIADSNSSDIFYKGKIAKDLVQDIKNAGGIITEEDMAKYASRWLKPVKVALDNLTLYSVPPPGSGALLSFMLNILDGYHFTKLTSEDQEVEFYHRLIETFKFAYAKRMDLDDSNSNEIRQLVANLTSEEFAESVRLKINDTRTFDPSYYGVEGLAKDDHGTAHMAVVDRSGNAVSVTSTVNLYYGSLVRSKSTGILLNDEMDDFSSNRTNAFGVPPTKANRIHPGRRPMSSMSPAIFVDHHNNVRLAIGSSGGTQITSSIALVTARNLWLGKNIKVAIDEHRLHDQIFPLQTSYEKGFSEKLRKRLTDLGHNMKELQGRGSVVQGIARGPDGRLYANSDYRKGGKVDGY